jgi:hypothetical protein
LPSATAHANSYTNCCARSGDATPAIVGPASLGTTFGVVVVEMCGYQRQTTVWGRSRSKRDQQQQGADTARALLRAALSHLAILEVLNEGRRQQGLVAHFVVFFVLNKSWTQQQQE